MEQAGSYDLLAGKPGWKPEAALIVTPYVEHEFFLTVAQGLCPRQMYVVIDDGCRREDIETVRNAVTQCGKKKPPTLICKLGSAPGLVHIKLFYVRWRTPAKQVAHSLVFGSANATRQGFSGADNAELVAITRLAASRHRRIIQWCNDVIEATKAKAPVSVSMVRDVELALGMRLRLPGITVGREVATLSNFDLWLQRGYLLSDYRPDPGFLHVPIQLEKGLPQAELASIAEAAGFAVRQTKRLRYRFVDAQVDLEDDDDEALESTEQAMGNWRRRLFVWTNLGDWCSEACYDAHEQEFRRRGFEDRVHALEQLDTLREKAVRDAKKQQFLNDMEKLWQRFGKAAPTLLKGSRKLDRRTYGDLFEQRVERDLALAKDPEFRDRFLRGFELVEVPRFRNDVTGWKGFVESLARQLSLDAVRGRSQSMLLKAVREGLKKGGTKDSVCQDHHKLIGALRDMWRHADAGPKGPAAILARYHVPTAPK